MNLSFTKSYNGESYRRIDTLLEMKYGEYLNPSDIYSWVATAPP